MNSLLSKITLFLALALPAGAVNIAPGGTGIMGATQQSGSGDNAYYHGGQLAHLCDGNPATRVDNYRQYQEHTHGYAGVAWAAARKESVKSVTVTMATFSDFGWFGSREVPPPGSALAPAHVRPDARGGLLAEPILQATRSPSPLITTAWFTVASTNDYTARFTGHVLPPPGSPPTSRSFTFTLRERPVGITGIRVVGPMGGTGCMAVFEIAVEADPIVDTDNNQMNDAWEIGKFVKIAAHDADDDPDNDGSNALLEYGFNMNPSAWDAPPAAVLEGNYLTLTLSKRPLIKYSILSGASLMDFDVAGTTTLINDATTLKVRDNFPITGPTSRRFMIVRVTALP